MTLAPFRWRALGPLVTLWRGASRTLPMGAFECTEEELAGLLRARGWKVTR